MESSAFGRLVGALVSPVATFRSLAERPTWLVAFLLVAFVPLVGGLLALPKIDWEDITRDRIEQSGVDVPASQVEQQVEMTEKIGPISTYLQPLMMVIFMLLVALVMWGAFTLTGGAPGFQRSLAVVSHSLLPLVVAQLLSIPVVLSTETIGADEIKTGSLLQSSLAYFAGDDTGPVMLALLSSLDVFTIWTLVLLAIGFHFAAKAKPATAGLTVVLLWLFLWVGIKVGFTALGAMMGGGGG
jgi:hypothetical protein